ncbi:hypothetical protein LAZ67_22002236 [Cordylochernes scorpioides]|uniref:ISXO2-like transposase domain-containing protein n=1 Tax=Cordylochernes scorpioides TaxID=51811 RepID=A0ABY6LPU7_9ARAC|nr:hypothetical protein LAZ67_22002236 [Cordylochernes scorpioides]
MGGYKSFNVVKYGTDWVVKTEIKTISEESGVSDDTVTHWVNFCREVCYLLYLDDPPKIGVGKQVQIDESLFGHNKKTRNHCAKTATGYWEHRAAHGGVDFETKDFFFDVVADRRAHTFIASIKKYVLPGTTIVSDGFRSYYRLEGFNHLVNHKLHIKDPKTGVHTNNFEATLGGSQKITLGEKEI